MLLDVETLDTLQKLGLSAYEAKAYMDLVASGPTTATVLSAEAAIPRTKIYEALRRTTFYMMGAGAYRHLLIY
jgi:sugar-specific transcriptional regulator TrmB